MSADAIVLNVPAGAPLRVDLFIAGTIPDTSRSQVQKGIKQGGVRINGQPIARPSTPVKAGDQVQWTALRPEPMLITPEAIPLDIRYEDESLLVVNKPPGMPTHPGPGHNTGTLVHALLHHVGGRAVAATDRPQDQALGLSTLYEGPCIRPGIVHRLDKDTSGLLVVAKDDVTHRRLAAQFETRTIVRTYHGIVWGTPQPPKGRIDASIGRDSKDRKKMAVVVPQSGKRAVTLYKIVEPLEWATLLAFRLETGRTHQIRVHAKHMGHPILGDATYGARTKRWASASSQRRASLKRLSGLLRRQALHAKDLKFVHPRTGETVALTTALPQDLQATLDVLRAEV